MTFDTFFEQFSIFFAVLRDCNAESLQNGTFVSGENGIGGVNVFMFTFLPNLKKSRLFR